MSKSYKRHSNTIRFDLLALFVITVCYVMFYQNMPNDRIVGIIFTILLCSIIVYLLFSPVSLVIKMIVVAYKRHSMNKIIRSTADIDNLSWSEFENYVADKLRKQGYSRVCLTEQFDLGIDVIARKNGINWGVQVKHYSNTVSIDAVREAVAALKSYKCDRAMVVINSFFTEPAKRLAKANDCILIDRKELAKWGMS